MTILTSRLRGQRLALARVLLVAMPAFLVFGYNQSATGGILAYPSFVHAFPEIDTTDVTGKKKVHKATIQGTVVAMYNIGCLIGALAAVPLGNRMGRRRALAISCIIGLIGHALQASSFSLGQLIAGRIVAGIGLGGMNALVPVWQSESVKPKSRGKNVVVVTLFITIGQAMASWINYGLGVIPHQSVAWRLPLAIPAIFILVLLASIFLFPESPHWLTSKGRLQEARDVYSVLDDLPADSEAIRIKVAAVADSFEQHEDAKGWLRIVSRDQKSKTFYRACIAFFVNFNASMSGANGVTYYAQTIFTESLHFATREAAVLSASLLSWKIIVALIPLYVVDRFGRRPLFITSGIGMSLCMVGLAATVSQLDHSQAAGDVAVLFLFLFFAFFPVAYLGANFLYATEIAPQELRVHFSAIGTATHWLFNFVVAEIVPTSFASIGYRTYIIFAVLSAFSVPLVILFFPETKGFALQDLDKIFESASHWYNVPRLAKQYLREANDPEIGGDGVSIGLEKDLDDGAKEVENVTKG